MSVNYNYKTFNILLTIDNNIFYTHCINIYTNIKYIYFETLK